MLCGNLPQWLFLLNPQQPEFSCQSFLTHLEGEGTAGATGGERTDIWKHVGALLGYFDTTLNSSAGCGAVGEWTRQAYVVNNYNFVITGVNGRSWWAAVVRDVTFWRD